MSTEISNAIVYNANGVLVSQPLLVVDTPTTTPLTSAHIFVGNGSGLAADVAVSGALTLANTGAFSLVASSVTGSLLTGYVSGAGTVAATDTILQGINKLNGNITALGSPITALTGDVTATGPGSVAATIASGHVTPSKISTANTDLFVFPAQVTINQAPGGVFAGDSTLVLKGASVDSYLTVDNLNRVFLLNGGKGFRLDTGDNIYLLTDLRGNGNNIKTTGVMSAGTETPAVTAQLDVTSTTKGFLPPRMTTTQRDTITSPSEGLQIYNTTTHVNNFFNGTVWGPVSSSSSPLAVVALTAQGADIGSTVLFTAPSTGLYGLNVYMVTTTTDAGAGTPAFNITYTDDSGANSLPNNTSIALNTAGITGELSFPIEVTSGNTLSYSVTGGGTYGTAKYSLYITATKLF